MKDGWIISRHIVVAMVYGRSVFSMETGWRWIKKKERIAALELLTGI